jgi:hypothetical protein
MNTCQVGIKSTVEKYVSGKSYLGFNGKDFIQIFTSVKEKVNPSNFYGVATSVANSLNKAINSDLVLGRVFYPTQTPGGVVGVSISPTAAQLNLLNAKEEAEIQEALAMLDAETPEPDRLDIENDLAFGVDESGDSFIAYQNQEMVVSKANSETVALVKDAAVKMGIDMQALSDYAKANPDVDVKDVNGLADLTRGVVAISTGKEDTAITEEVVHVATAILEQTNPQLITALISKIDRFKIYKQVFDTYSKLKAYQLPNGKPDIRKIKKEAVDKLIAEVIVNQSEGSTEFPELMQEETRSMIKQWWDTIKDYIKDVYSKTNIDLFQKAGLLITEGEVNGTISDLVEGGVFFQAVENKVRDEYYDKVIAESNKMIYNPKTPTDTRHYLYEGQRVAKSVTEKLDENKKEIGGDEIDKMIYDQKKDFGNAGHDLIENEILINLIDKDGFAKKEFTNTPIASDLEPTIQEKIKTFIRELIRSYPEGTRFLIEKMVINTKEKGMLASKVDFKAIIPVINKEGQPDIKVDTLDWKFMGIDKNKTEDVPFYKRKDWIAQMLEYVKIDRNYGLKPDQTRKSRMVPFIVNYEYNVPGVRKSGVYAKSLEIGKLDSTQETNLYLLPVPIMTESTGKKEVDKLILALRKQWEKLYSKSVAPENRDAKNLQLNEIDKAIRHLHVKLDFEPLYNVGKTFLDSAATTFKSFENIDYSNLSAEQIQEKLGELLSYQASAQKFTNLDQVFLSHISREDMSPADKLVLSRLEDISKATERMMDRIEQIQKDYVVQLALKEGFTTETEGDSILDAEVAVTGFAKTFLEASKLSSKIINLASNLWLRAKSLTDISVSNKIDDFEKVLIPAFNEARAKGKSVFDLIGRVYNGELSLNKKIDSKFLTEIDAAKEKGDKQFFLTNLNIDEYNRLAQEMIKKGEAEINAITFASSEEQDDAEKTYRISKLKDSLDITRPTFNGYKDYKFGELVKKTLIEEGHYSEEYAQMAKSQASLDLWNFITALNDEAAALGFITNQGTSFLPLIEATVLEKLAQSKDLALTSKDIFTDLYTVRVDEEQTYSATDKETGEIRKQIPKYFTRTNKAVEQLSKDVTKIIPLYIKALQEYKTAKNMENTLLTLHSVEQAKGSLITNADGDIIFEGEVPKINEAENKNAELLQTIVDDSLYGLGEDLGSLGNTNLNTFVSKFAKSEEGKQKGVVSIKKGLKSADTLVRALAVGLKPLIGIANWAGGQFQAYINAGGFYNFLGDFEKNNLMVTSGVGFTTLKKGLLDMFIPLGEDVTEERIKKLSKEQSYIKWLGAWSFTDVMMATNSFPERKLQFANALSMLDNAMVVDGKIVNIRQYLSKQDSKAKYDLSYTERKALEDSFEDRVKALRESSSLEKIAKIENDKVVIPGVSDEAIANYRVTIREYGRTLNGQMSEDNKAGFRRDSLLTSFMMFKTWIPKLLYSRVGDIKKNAELDQWEYGRARAFIKVWANVGLLNIKSMRDVYLGNEEGLKIMDELLEAKKEEHYRKTGQVLQITNEEFYDLMRTQITNQMKELSLLFSTMALLVAAKAAEPPEDATDFEKNRYKYWAKGLNKIADEVSFYYNPASADSITRGSIIPALGLLAKSQQVINSVSKEVTGYVLNDQKMMDKAYPTKYFLNMIPGAAQFQSDILPLIDPELAKEMGIRVTAESRQR